MIRKRHRDKATPLYLLRHWWFSSPFYGAMKSSASRYRKSSDHCVAWSRTGTWLNDDCNCCTDRQNLNSRFLLLHVKAEPFPLWEVLYRCWRRWATPSFWSLAPFSEKVSYRRYRPRHPDLSVYLCCVQFVKAFTNADCELSSFNLLRSESLHRLLPPALKRL